MPAARNRWVESLHSSPPERQMTHGGCEWRVGRGPSGTCAEEGVANGPVQVQEARDGQGEAGEGRGGSPHRGQICLGGEKGSHLVDILHVHAQGSSSGEWPAESKKSEKSQDPPRSLETYNGSLQIPLLGFNLHTPNEKFKSPREEVRA